jgi:hypothetical protein
MAVREARKTGFWTKTKAAIVGGILVVAVVVGLAVGLQSCSGGKSNVVNPPTGPGITDPENPAPELPQTVQGTESVLNASLEKKMKDEHGVNAAETNIKEFKVYNNEDGTKTIGIKFETKAGGVNGKTVLRELEMNASDELVQSLENLNKEANPADNQTELKKFHNGMKDLIETSGNSTQHPLVADFDTGSRTAELANSKDFVTKVLNASGTKIEDVENINVSFEKLENSEGHDLIRLQAQTNTGKVVNAKVEMDSNLFDSIDFSKSLNNDVLNIIVNESNNKGLSVSGLNNQWMGSFGEQIKTDNFIESQKATVNAFAVNAFNYNLDAEIAETNSIEELRDIKESKYIEAALKADISGKLEQEINALRDEANQVKKSVVKTGTNLNI